MKNLLFGFLMAFGLSATAQSLQINNTTNCDLYVKMAYSTPLSDCSIGGVTTYAIAANSTIVVTPPAGTVFIASRILDAPTPTFFSIEIDNPVGCDLGLPSFASETSGYCGGSNAQAQWSNVAALIDIFI